MSVVREGASKDPMSHPAGTSEVMPDPGNQPGGSAHAPTPGVAPASALPRYRRIVASLVIADTCCILGALLVVYADGPTFTQITRDLALVMVVSPIVWVSVFHSFGLYAIRHLSAPEELRRLISATTLAIVVIMVGSFWWDEGLARSTLAITWVVSLLAELLVRRLTRWHIRKQKRLGRLALRTVIVGMNDEALAIAEAIAPPVRGFVPLGFIGSPGPNGSANSLPILGTIDDLADTIRKVSAECVIVASTTTSPHDVYRIARLCRDTSVDMRVSANTPEILTSRVSIQQIHNLVMLAVRPARLTGPQAASKRSVDLLVASLGTVLLAPVMGFISLAIKGTSAGPVLFRQERVTKGGRRFTMFKFRTMVIDPERVLEGREIDPTQPFFKLRDDPRLTRFGRLLRSFSLDELPQLWNVLRGDMSLVGPRPLPVEQVEANLDLLRARHEVRAGLTGWWQISGRSDTALEEAVKMDLFYIENWSLTLDLYVLLKTVGVVVERTGAY